MPNPRSRAPRRRIIGANWEAQRPIRGRPPAARPRKATRIYLTSKQREHWSLLTEGLSQLAASRIEVADLAIQCLDDTLQEMQRGLTGSGQLLPVGVVDLKSLYFLLDLKPPTGSAIQYNITMFTETRERMSVLTIRLQSAFRATWSQVFGLGIELLHHRLASQGRDLAILAEVDSLAELKTRLFQPQQLRLTMG
jgi:hypothetical protein